MKRKSKDPFRETRDVLFDALADAAKAVERRRPKASRRARDDAAKPAEQGDFLQDLIQLNLEYLNQVARLGSSYSVVASRALEGLFDYFAPGEAEDAKDDEETEEPPMLVGVAGETRVLELTLYNPGRVPLDVELVLDSVASLPKLKQQHVLPKEKLPVAVTVAFTTKLTLRKHYEVLPKIASYHPHGKPGAVLKPGEPPPTLDVPKFIVCRVKA